MRQISVIDLLDRWRYMNIRLFASILLERIDLGLMNTYVVVAIIMRLLPRLAHKTTTDWKLSLLIVVLISRRIVSMILRIIVIIIRHLMVRWLMIVLII